MAREHQPLLLSLYAPAWAASVWPSWATCPALVHVAGRANAPHDTHALAAAAGAVASAGCQRQEKRKGKEE